MVGGTWVGIGIRGMRDWDKVYEDYTLRKISSGMGIRAVPELGDSEYSLED